MQKGDDYIWLEPFCNGKNENGQRFKIRKRKTKRLDALENKLLLFKVTKSADLFTVFNRVSDTRACFFCFGVKVIRVTHCITNGSAQH